MKKDYETDDNKKIIHLYVISRCTNSCPLCCNNEYDIEKIPVVTVDELKNAETVCLTGGEPFLYEGICDFAQSIKKQYPNITNIYVYTSGLSLGRWFTWRDLHHIDGINISPKGKHDMDALCRIFKYNYLTDQIYKLKSSRFYQFPDIKDEWVEALNIDKNSTLKIIKREWQEHFEPVSGIFRRIPVLFDGQ